MNKRVFDDVEDVSVNGINLGGLSAIAIAQSYMDEVEADDGGQGPDEYSESGERTDIDINSSDVLELIPLLISTPGTAEFSGHESGTAPATYVKSTIGTAASKIVCHTASLNVSRGAFATMSVQGTVRTDGVETFSAVAKHEVGQAAPTLQYPARLWKPTGMTHGAQTILHPVDFSMAISPRRLLVLYDGDDVGVTVVDIPGWTITGGLTVHDSSKDGVNDWDVMTKLIAAGLADLTIAVEGVGSQGDMNLIVRNVKFRKRDKRSGRQVTQHALTWVAQFRDPGGTERTVDAAISADRMVNFAA